MFTLAIVAAASITAAPANACGTDEYTKAASLLADSSLRVDSTSDDAERVLRGCGDDPTAEYLIGMFPRFVEFSPEKMEEYRRLLAKAADHGNAAAALIHGIWLFDAKGDRDRGPKLITDAYAIGDEWAIGYGLRLFSAQGNRLSPEAITRIKQLSVSGFPFAYGILAAQELYRISDSGDQLPPDKEAADLLNVHYLALQGIIRGDEIALMAEQRVEKEFDVRPGGWDALRDALSAPDPLGFAISNPKRMEAAHLQWRSIMSLDALDPSLGPVVELLKPIVNGAQRACTGFPSKIERLCDIRAVVDHAICMKPFGSYMDPEKWAASSAYRTCRLLRLRSRPATLYYQ
ncbi:MAG: hypothetical protein R3D05_06425 [Dongiaceae bacterium]